MAFSIINFLRAALESTAPNFGEASVLMPLDTRRLRVHDGSQYRNMSDYLVFTADQDYAPSNANRQSRAAHLIYSIDATSDRTIDLSGASFNDLCHLTVVNRSLSGRSISIKYTASITQVVYPGESITAKCVFGQWVDPGMAGENLFINGDMEVDQRNNGASRTFTAGAGRNFGVDRWYVTCTGGNAKGQQVDGNFHPKAFRVLGAAGVTATECGQIVESINAARLKGRLSTVSVEISSSSVRSLTYVARRAASVEDNWTGPTTLDSQTLTIGPTPKRVTFSLAPGLSAGLGISVAFQTGALPAGEWVQFEGAKLEDSPVYTKHGWLQPEIELERCQRFCFVADAPATGAPQIAYGHALSAGQATVFIPFPVRMRVTPSRITGVPVGDYRLSDGLTSYAIGSYSTSSTTNRDRGVIGVNSSGMTAFRPVYLECVAASPAPLGFDAEI